jgi:transcriptional regulator with XRE-family HTH domain
VEIGEILRAARNAAGLSLAEMAGRTNFGRTHLGNVETGARTATPAVIAAYERALGDHLNRRTFLSVAAGVATQAMMAGEIFSSIAASDPGPLATVQTTHATDLVIASHVDPAARKRLRTWMTNGSDPVLRVNAAGIMAKLSDQETAGAVATVLTHDPEVRARYLTAVAARVGDLDWDQAARLVGDPYSLPAAGVRAFARKLSRETLNARDAGARWCSAVLLRDLSPRLV